MNTPKRVTLATYGLLTVLFIIAVNLYVASHPLYRGKAGRIDALYAKLQAASATPCPDAPEGRTLVIGNSYVNRSFALETDCRFIKFTVSGMPLQDAARIIEHLKPEDRVARVIVGVGYNEANPVHSDASMYMRYWASLPWYRWLWSLPMVRGRGMALTLLREDAKCILGSECARVELAAARDDEPEARVVPDADKFRRSIEMRYREYVPFTASVSASFRETIKDIADACHDRGIPVLLYTAPIAPELHDRLGESFLAAFHEQAQPPGVTYVDFNDRYEDWEQTYFADATHVSEKGARIVTENLLEMLGEPAPQTADAPDDDRARKPGPTISQLRRPGASLAGEGAFP